jgi:CRP/FNR family transcriptional regulator, cyclic AMP receptor protein
MPDDPAAIVAATTLFSGTPADDLTLLVQRSRLRRLRRGQIVFSAGDPGEGLVVVIAGRLKVVVHSADGGELTLTVIGPGGVLGGLSVADGGARSADAEAMEDSQVLLIPREAVLDLSRRIPSVADALLASVAADLRRLTDATSDLVFLDLPRRVAKAILDLPRDQDGVSRFRVTQEELAHQVGGTRQSVNAALRGFERRRWITLRDRAVVIIDDASLTRFAGG